LLESNLDDLVACYHEKHYKISFNNTDADILFGGQNNVEVWLNINKMIERKGTAEWVGPHEGRSIVNTFIEDQAGDGLTSGERWCVGFSLQNLPGGKAIFLADVEPSDADEVVEDFIPTQPVESMVESKDFEISNQDNNWNKLIKRWYWKIKTNNDAPGLDFTDSTYMDGILADTQVITAVAPIVAGWKAQPYRLINIFPLTRIRGRTIKKTLSTLERISISGLQINYEVERRRI
jgi:hypothetical protein